VFASVLALPLLLASLFGQGAVASTAAPSGANAYATTPLVSDQPGVAAQTDPHLVNAWGLVAGPSTPWWVANNGTDTSTLYDGDGNILPLVVKVPGAPTGTAFNAGSGFVIHHRSKSGPSVFLFATETGQILGWNPNVGPTRAVVAVDRSGVDAIYKGLALLSTAGGSFLYASDFHNGRVDVFDQSFHLVSTAGSFADPNLPPHFAPFGIRDVGGRVLVTYAKQDRAREDEVAGPGLGFVDMFDAKGHLLQRVASRGDLNAPWGLAVAPASFGRFEGDLLVGNFGDGRISAFRMGSTSSRRFEECGQLRGPDGHPLAIDGLWALSFGNDGPAGSSGSLYFTAGPVDETHGLFGKIEPAA
jgi:uncharacterized protein (TIGR03118 family)